MFRHKEIDLPITPNTFTWRFKLILKNHGLLVNLTVHRFLHTAAGLMIAKETNVATVAGSFVFN